MLPPPGGAGPEDHSILHAAVALSTQIGEAKEEGERNRPLPAHIAAAMQRAGIFGMAMPQVWGGPELDPIAQIRVIETLAMADGVAGWCAMINCDGGYGTALLDQAIARDMYQDINVATGAATKPTSTATPVPGGYRVNGRFPFVSGVHHCEWVWLGCVVTEDSAAKIDQKGVPVTRQCRQSAKSWTLGIRPVCGA